MHCPKTVSLDKIKFQSTCKPKFTQQKLLFDKRYPTQKKKKKFVALGSQSNTTDVDC